MQNDCDEEVESAFAVKEWAGASSCSDGSCEGTEAPAGHTCTADLYFESDLVGSDIGHQAVEDWAACCDLCATTAECNAW